VNVPWDAAMDVNRPGGAQKVADLAVSTLIT